MRRLAFVVPVLLLVVLACAPQAAPSPSSPSPTPQAPAPASAAATPAVVQGDAALQKLIEAAKKEGSVNLYSFNLIGDVGLAMQKAFKDRYGIKVDIITGRGAEFVERLKTEARTGNRTGDFVEGSSLHLANMKNMGLTTSLRDLPVLKEKGVWKMDPTLPDPDGNLLAAYPFFHTPLLNSSMIKPADEPKSWADLLQPKWKGKILFTDPVVSSNGYIVLQPLVRAGILTEDYIAKLGNQDLVFVTGPPQAVERLARGELPLFVAGQASHATNAVREGAPIKALDFKEGMVGDAVLQAVVKDAPHINAGKLFANWWLSQEGQAVYSQARGAPTIRKDTPSGLPPSLDANPANPVLTTADDTNLQGKMFQDKTWVPAFKKTK